MNGIAQQVGIHWRTAKKYADQSNWNETTTKKKSRSPVMGPFMEIVDTWLEKDRLLPRKQRHTGVRIYRRLREEYQFTGGQRTVLAYVCKRKSELALDRAKSYERLEHPPGEAQVDFTTLEVSQGHKLLVVSLPSWISEKNVFRHLRTGATYIRLNRFRTPLLFLAQQKPISDT